MINFLKTTWNLWMDVPGKPPLWKCALVSLAISNSGCRSRMGFLDLDRVMDEMEEDKKEKRHRR